MMATVSVIYAHISRIYMYDADKSHFCIIWWKVGDLQFANVYSAILYHAMTFVLFICTFKQYPAELRNFNSWKHHRGSSMGTSRVIVEGRFGAHY